MNIKRILCPIDFSKFNLGANEYASMLARSAGARIIYLHAFLPNPYRTPPAQFDALVKEKELVREMETLSSRSETTLNVPMSLSSVWSQIES